MQSLRSRFFQQPRAPDRALLNQDFEKLKSAAPGLVHNPDPAGLNPPIALALSGGGFRATLSALGVMRFLADAGLLSDVRAVSSVSGGSIASGMLAKTWSQLEAEDFEPAAFNNLVLFPIVEKVSTGNLQRSVLLNTWRSIGPRSLSDVMSTKLDEWFYDGVKLDEIPPTPGSEDTHSGIRFIFNASDIRTGRRFGFRQTDMGEWGDKRFTAEGVRLSQAVAASCAVPGVFAAIKLKVKEDPQAQPRLVDGGVYDTLGLDAIDHPESHAMIISVDAGGVFNKPGRRSRLLAFVPFAGQATAYMRSSEMMNRVNSTERIQVMVERFRGWRDWHAAGGQGDPPEWTRRGVLFGLHSRLPDAPAEWQNTAPEVPDWAGNVTADAWGNELAAVETSLNKFSREQCKSLIYRSWWLAGASLARWHPELFRSESYPEWADF